MIDLEKRRKKNTISFIFALLITSVVATHPPVISVPPPLTVPSFLKAGDLMFIESRHELGLTDIPGWDHVVMYTGVGNLFIEAVTCY